MPLPSHSAPSSRLPNFLVLLLSSPPSPSPLFSFHLSSSSPTPPPSPCPSPSPSSLSLPPPPYPTFISTHRNLSTFITSSRLISFPTSVVNLLHSKHFIFFLCVPLTLLPRTIRVHTSPPRLVSSAPAQLLPSVHISPLLSLSLCQRSSIFGNRFSPYQLSFSSSLFLTSELTTLSFFSLYYFPLLRLFPPVPFYSSLSSHTLCSQR